MAPSLYLAGMSFFRMAGRIELSLIKASDWAENSASRGEAFCATFGCLSAYWGSRVLV